MANILGKTNPLRYRGYVYDQETELYYLQSRYYDPEVGRFINADALTATGQGLLGNNMFAYCGNNPINFIDPSGNSWLALIIAAVVCCVILSGCEETGPYSGASNCYAYAMNQEYDPSTNEPFKEKPQPGTFSGNPLTQDELDDAIQNGTKEDVENLIIGRVEDDCAVLGYSIRKVNSADSFPGQGHWLIALGYSTSDNDYHFWKKYMEPVWYHKPGTDPVMQWDWSHNPISDPAQSNRGKYDQFIGYYSIGLG